MKRYIPSYKFFSAQILVRRDLLYSLLHRIFGALHFSDPYLNLEKISRALYVNSQYLCKVFKRHSGETIGGYLSSLRMDHARQLLEDGAANLTAVAGQCGFTDVTTSANALDGALVSHLPDLFHNECWLLLDSSLMSACLFSILSSATLTLNGIDISRLHIIQNRLSYTSLIT